MKLKPTDTKLVILALPTIHQQFALHPLFLKPKNKSEYAILFSSYVLRKWRYQISDSFASYWHSFGHSSSINSPFKFRIYQRLNSLITRKSLDEYFFKNIPARTTEVEFVYPKDSNEQELQKTVERWLKTSAKFKTQATFWLMTLPITVIMGKLYVIPANVFLVYHLFRTFASIRAFQGSMTLQKLLNGKNVQWIPDEDLQKDIENQSTAVV